MKDNDFQDLLKSIDQAREIHKEKRAPSRAFKLEPIEVKKIRTKLHVSQPEFALMIGVSVATLRNWEQGRTVPEGAARALLKVAAKKPRAVLEALYR
jgi:putative transcriptional regulator